jgi:DNA-directed RNA polymerase subunit beta
VPLASLVEGQILAARTTASNSTITQAALKRISFAKISEPLEIPKLLSLQTDSFNWLIGNDAWQEQIAARESVGEDVSHKSGLRRSSRRSPRSRTSPRR